VARLLLISKINVMTEKDLLALKKRISEARTERDKLEGKLEGLMEELFEKWQCASVEEADEKLVQLEAEAAELQEQINTGIKELEDLYNVEAD